MARRSCVILSGIYEQAIVVVVNVGDGAENGRVDFKIEDSQLVV